MSCLEPECQPSKQDWPVSKAWLLLMLLTRLCCPVLLLLQVYYYLRALAVATPFATAKENLLLLFERTRTK
jgi:hypothetical protein